MLEDLEVEEAQAFAPTTRIPDSVFSGHPESNAVAAKRHTSGMTPETRYAKSGNVHIAYQVVGDGPIDVVLIPGLFTHVERQWDEPSFARFLTRLASFSRLIVFDARGAGLSDQAPNCRRWRSRWTTCSPSSRRSSHRQRRSSDSPRRAAWRCCLRPPIRSEPGRSSSMAHTRRPAGTWVPVGTQPRVDRGLRPADRRGVGSGVFLPGGALTTGRRTVSASVGQV